MTNPRIKAAAILEQVIHGKQSLPGLLPPDPIVRATCYGVLRYLPRLEYFAARLLNQPLTKQGISVQMLLFIGMYQLMDMDIPDHAAISETVEAAREMDKEWACKLINGVLRTFQREFGSLDKASLKNEEARFAHLDWMMKLIKKAWPNDWEDILNANNVKAPMFLRVNLLQTTTEEYCQLLEEAGISAVAIEAIPGCIQLETPVSHLKLPKFEEGLVSIQDAAPQMVMPLMQLKPNLRVLDVCAAPGGKTTHMLEAEPKLKELIAIDIDSHRCKQIKENLKRLKLSAIVIPTDATDTAHWWNKDLFDRILIDAPCSGMGVIRRHPDIKYLRRPSDFESLPRQQLHLLEKMWPLLKSKGLLVYATCSIMPQENEQVIAAFLKNNPDAVVQPITLCTGMERDIGWQVLPTIDGPDGFYYAVLQKK